MADVPTAMSVGAIALRLGVPVHRVQYVARTRGIRASAKAGNAHVFDEAAVDRIADELRRLAAQKGDRR